MLLNNKGYLVAYFTAKFLCASLLRPTVSKLSSAVELLHILDVIVLPLFVEIFSPPPSHIFIKWQMFCVWNMGAYFIAKVRNMADWVGETTKINKEEMQEAKITKMEWESGNYVHACSFHSLYFILQTAFSNNHLKYFFTSFKIF